MKKDKSSEESISVNFEFVEGNIPNGFKPDHDIQLFNSQEHRKTQSKKNWKSFHLLKVKNRKVLASIHFCIEKGVAMSPMKAPYGSFDLSEAITTSQLFEFIGYVEQRLRRLGSKKIVIKNYPEQYHVRHHNTLTVLLFNHKYRINTAELGACIRINEESFLSRLDAWEKRKLKQAEKARLTFKVISPKEFKDTFNFILRCRRERDQSLSMSYAELNKTVEVMEEYFISFGVYDGSELLAASIAVKTNRQTIYNFYSGHSKASDHLSPVVALIGGMYQWCQNHKVKLLDLGTSAWGGKPNFSLIDFKLRLGAEPTMKLTFEKNI